MFGLFNKKKSDTVSLPYTTDIHSHIIPGIDDGSPDVEHSVALVKQMQEWGVKRIITTPHVTEETFENTPETITAAYNLLKEALGEDAPEIIFSAEYRMDENFLKHVKNDILIPLPGNHILIENSFLQPFWDLKGLIYQLQLKGFNPILAHPERYAYYYDEKEIYTDIYNSGCMFQLNWLSLAGYYGKETRNIAYWLIEKGYVDFLGTDLHNRRHARAITEFLQTKEYRKLVEKLNLKNDTLK